MFCVQAHLSSFTAAFRHVYTNGRGLLLHTSVAACILILANGAQAKQDTVLYSFAGGTDAQDPLFESLGVDKSGNLYGTTQGGGADGLGAVFEVAPDGTETVLHSFAGSPDGSQPYGGVIVDSAGNLYGTTTYGGNDNDGTVYKLSSDGTMTILFSFGGTRRGYPTAGLLRDKKGNLYGTAAADYGYIFKLTPGGKYKVLHTFDGEDGDDPVGNLIMDSTGSLYGVTHDGGSGTVGTVFRIASDGTFTILHAFSGGTADGATPEAGLVMDPAGNLYGTTAAGAGQYGQTGTVFKITPDGTETILTDFGGGNILYAPAGALVLDGTGNLYGTTASGGSTTNCTGGCGIVFQLAPDGTLSYLHQFQGGTADGASPYGGVILRKGYLFGTTDWGSYGYGTVFQLRK